MLIHNPTRRHTASMLARCGVALSVVGLGISVWNMSFSGVGDAGAAATDAGEAIVVYPADGGPNAGQPLETGGSTTPFSMKLPQGAACTFDSANGDYRVQSYMVPEAVSPAGLGFDASGPTPQSYAGSYADFRMPLWDITQDEYADRGTATADPAPGPGQILDIPSLFFGVYATGDIPVGTYNIGIACTDPDRVGDKYWNARSRSRPMQPTRPVWCGQSPPAAAEPRRPPWATARRRRPRATAPRRPQRRGMARRPPRRPEMGRRPRPMGAT